MSDQTECPTCGEPYRVQCRCPRRDRSCPNGHHWHQCRVCGATVLGQSDHADPKSGYCPECLAAGAAGAAGGEARVILWA